MHADLKEIAVSSVKQAIEEDNAGNYGRALPLYMNALEKFSAYLKHQRNPKIKKAITCKFVEYLRRAEEIQAVLQEERRRSDKEDDGNQKLDRLTSAIDSTIVRDKPNVKWSDVVGLDSVKKSLQEAIVLPVYFPQFFTGKRRPWSAFLLYGPPGTGKSYLAKAVATESNSTFFSLSSSDLISKWMGESEKLVSQLFQLARANSPSIIFIDEVDSLCSQRGNSNESEASRRVKTEFLVQMQGVGKNEERVLILAATNTPYALDQAIRRRFDKRIYIPLPDLDARQHMFKLYMADSAHNLTMKDFESIAQKTEGFSGSDISVCVNEVLFEPIRKAKGAKFFKRDPNKMWTPCEHDNPAAIPITLNQLDSRGLASKVLAPPVTKLDFDKVLTRHKPTVSKSDLEVHERFTAEFGETASGRLNPENPELSAFGFQETNGRQQCVVRKQVVHEYMPLCLNTPTEWISGVETVEEAEVEKTSGEPTTESSSMASENYYGEQGDSDDQVPVKSKEGICYRNRRLIVNSSIAICILISFVPLFLHWIFGGRFLPFQFRLVFLSKYL